MTINLKIKGDLTDIIRKITDLDDGLKSGQILNTIAQLLNSRIQIRVQKKGEGPEGNSLLKYSASYARIRSASKRQIAFRDLTYSGKMWQSLTTKPGNYQAKMFFGNAESVNKASGNNKRTPFFELSEDDNNFIKKYIKDNYINK
jgi:hypothetical protein